MPMPLLVILADAAATAEHPATWISAISLVVAAWLGSRDRNRIGILEEKVETCEKRHQECEESHGKTKAELMNTKTELKKRDEEDKAELLAEIELLRKTVNKKKDETSEHKPLGG